MDLVQNRFSTYRLFAGGAQAAARFYVGLAETAGSSLWRRWRTGKVGLSSTNDLLDIEYRSSSSRQSARQDLPGSVFDARYQGLTGDAAHLDAAICRRARLR
jgi:hypothetical protein